jgi:protocatechuate 3,4-dioxygenase beta subunit
MTTPEKLSSIIVVLFVAVAGYFLVDLLMDNSVEDPAGLTTEGETRNEDAVQIESRITDEGGNTDGGATAQMREEIVPEREHIEGTIYGIAFGRVVNESGKPIPDVVISIYRGGSSIFAHLPAQKKLDMESSTDGEGCYSLAGIERGDQYMVVANHPEYAESSVSSLKIKGGVKLEVADIVMGHGALVMGKVTARGGNPLTGALVEIKDPIRDAFLDEAERKPWKQIFTDEAGTYRFENVSMRTFELVVSAEGFATQRKPSTASFDVLKEIIVNFELTAGTFISGYVTDGVGTPMGDVKVEATMVHNKEYSSSGISFSQPDGTFMVDGLVKGTYVVRASKVEFSDDVKQGIESEASDVKMMLHPRGGVSGHVFDEVTGKPLTQFKVETYQTMRGRPSRRIKVKEEFKSPQGFYRLKDLEPGMYSFTVSADGYANCTSDEVAVVREYELDNVDIYMNRGGELTGTVVDPAGDPLPNVKVTLNENNFTDNPFFQLFSAMAGPDAPKRKTVVTNGAGQFHMKLIVPMIYQVAFTHPEYMLTAINDVEVFKGKDATPSMGEIVMSPGSKVTGRVLDVSGEPIQGATVNLASTDSKLPYMKQTSTDKKGQYSFNHVIPCEYKISAQIRQLKGKNVNIFKTLMLSQNTQQIVYLEEGKSLVVDIRLTE